MSPMLSGRPSSHDRITGQRVGIANRLTLIEDLAHHELERYFILEKREQITAIAARMGWSTDALSRCVRGVQPFPAGRLPSLCVATQSLRFLDCLVRALGKHLVDIPGLSPSPGRDVACNVSTPPLRLVADLTSILGRLAVAIAGTDGGNAGKDTESNDIHMPLDPENLEQLNKAIDEAHGVLELLRSVINENAGRSQISPRQKGGKS